MVSSVGSGFLISQTYLPRFLIFLANLPTLFRKILGSKGGVGGCSLLGILGGIGIFILVVVVVGVFISSFGVLAGFGAFMGVGAGLGVLIGCSLSVGIGASSG